MPNDMPVIMPIVIPITNAIFGFIRMGYPHRTALPAASTNAGISSMLIALILS